MIDRAVGGRAASAVSNSIWVFATLIVRKFGNTAVALSLAATLGVTGYGVYGVAISSLTLAATIALFGFERLTTREVASLLSRHAYGQMKSYLIYATKALVIVSLFIVFCAIIGIYVLNNFRFFDHPFIFYLSAACIPIFVCNRFLYGILCGFHRVVLGQTALAIVQPGVFLLLIGVFYFLNFSFTPVLAMNFFMVASASACTMMLWNTRKTVPEDVLQADPAPSSKSWMVSGALFLALGLYPVVNVELTVIILGAMHGPQSAGALRLAFEISGLISFVAVAISAPLGPLVANRIADDKIDELVNDVANLTRLAIVLAIPLTLIAIVLGKFFLGFFGSGFEMAYTTLVILAVGQLCFVIFAPLGVVLAMAGYEQAATKGSIYTIIISTSITTGLIWFFDLEGAAIGISIGLSLWNFLRIYSLQSILGISTRVISAALGLRPSRNINK